MIDRTFFSTCALAAMLAATPALAQQATDPQVQQPGQADEQLEAMPPAPDTAVEAQPAQPQDPVAPQPQMAAPAQLDLQGGFVIRQQPGQVLGSNLMDAEVVTINDESLGSVNDVLLDEQGRVAAIVVGVGGFLGIGQKEVGIPLEQAQVMFRSPADAGQDWWGGAGQIERIVVDFTREQLEDAPEFARLEDGDTMATGTTDGTAQPGAQPPRN